MRLYILYVFLLANVLSAFAQKEADKIFWQENILSWDDFKAPPSSDSPYHANTNAGMSYGWNIRQENGDIELQYEVLCFFNPNSSWVRPESKTEYLLQHEQLHFDITELYARKLRKKLAEVKPQHLKRDPRQHLNQLYEAIMKEKTLTQAKFDRETKHSINREAEVRWRGYVKREMNKYKKFSS